MPPPWTYKKNDTEPPIDRTLGFDVTGKTIDLVISITGSTLSVRKTIPGVTIVTPSTGEVEAPIPAGFLDVAGDYNAEWIVRPSPGGAKERTVPDTGYDSLTVEEAL